MSGLLTHVGMAGDAHRRSGQAELVRYGARMERELKSCGGRQAAAKVVLVGVVAIRQDIASNTGNLVTLDDVSPSHAMWVQRVAVVLEANPAT